ncbi:hypothetical protein M899_0833 [Bacteriovorax sp. BSW11_IV]|uniref:hypothetical protein n=1 Tax=Bacteriovorax sp. BSW11_IV TaxID=1353529 RepID=UPI000389E2F1|nr:hypothetical protein [Bacteriovorax sp. BSW11_IV]EQC42975.1 hypothetical protein M899_0833 [Bacteriovorax sp. BSW11_IV]
MFKLVVFVSLLSSSAFAMTIQKEKNSFFLVEKDLKIEVQSSGGDPTFLEKKAINDRVELLVYNSGMAGTSMPVGIIRAVIISKESKKNIGDYIYKLNYPEKVSGDQPKWDFTIPGVISILTTDGILKKVNY